MPGFRFEWSLCCLVVAILSGAIPTALAQTADAGVEISGGERAVEARVAAAPVKEVLTRLAARYGIEISGHRELDEEISGVYRGQIETVVGKILGNTSYLIETAAGVRRITVFAPAVSGERFLAAAAAPRPATSAPKGSQNLPLAPVRQTVAADAEPLSPGAQRLATKLFGPDAPALQIDEQYLNAYAARALRGNTKPRN